MKLINLAVLLSFIFYFYPLASVSQVPDSTWLRNISHQAGLDSARGARIWVVDINNDYYPDIVWGSGGISVNNRLYVLLNTENPDKNSTVTRIFRDFTDSSGLNANRNTAKTSRVTDIVGFADVNNDGFIDAVTSIYYHRLQYYQGGKDPGDRSEVLLGDGKGHFTLKLDNGIFDMKVVDTLPSGLVNVTGMSFLDYDYDGNIDLFCSTWYTDRAIGVPMPQIVLKGNGDGSFSLQKYWGADYIMQAQYGANVTDWDNDGWQDIMTSPYCNYRGSLLKNMQNNTFLDYNFVGGYDAQFMAGDNGQALCQWSAQPADFDNDGDMDILQVEVHGGYHKNEGRTHVAINNGPDSGYKYSWALDRIRRDAPTDSHLGDQGGNWFDLDGDGLQDILIAQMAYPDANLEGQERLYICQQDSTHYFNDISRAVGVFNIKEAHTPVPLDYDLDGDQDILTSRQVRDTIKVGDSTVYNIYMKIELLRNDIGNKNNWVSVNLNPSAGCNKTAIGSRIYIYSGKTVMMHEIQGGLGHFASLPPYLKNIGLGKRNRIDSIAVRWPRKDLTLTKIKNPPLNLILYINENNIAGFIKTWQGNKPVIGFNRNMLNFGRVDTGIHSNMNFKINNLGDSVLTINEIKLADDNLKSYFRMTFEKLPFTIEPGQSKDVLVEFTPTYRGDFSTGIVVTSNAQNRKQAILDLEAYGFQPQPMLTVSVPSIKFDTTYIDTTRTSAFEVSNIGELPLNISGISVVQADNAFILVESVNPFTLNSGEKRTFNVKFSPKLEFNYTGKISITSNAYNAPLKEIQLTGTGRTRKPIIALNRGLMMFGSVDTGKTKTDSLEISNTGDGLMTITEISVPNDYTEIFLLSGFSLPLNITPSSTVPVFVRFEPEEVKMYTTKLTIKSNAQNDSVKVVNLRGSGVIASVPENAVRNGNLYLFVYPNPFSSITTVKYRLENINQAELEIRVLDIYGRKLRELVNKVHFQGEYSVSLDLSEFPSGIYNLVAKTRDGVLHFPVVNLR